MGRSIGRQRSAPAQRTVGPLLVAALASGCIPIPAALPPLKASIGLGAAIGNPLPDRATGIPLTETEGVAHGRIGATPLALLPELNRRVVDLEVGYAFQVFFPVLRHNRNRHGFYGGVNVLMGHFWIEANWRLRIVARGFAEYFVMQDFPGDGGGGGWGLGFEVARYTNHERDGAGPVVGWYAGEWSLGAEAFGGVYSVGGADYGVIGLHLTARVPGILGVILIPLTGSF